MALFPWQQPQPINRRPRPAAVSPSRPMARPRRVLLPEFMHRLRVLCHDHRHPLPVAMTHIGDSTSHDGQPMAVYACPLCGTRQGWVIDVHTGRRWRLWTRPANGSQA